MSFEAVIQLDRVREPRQARSRRTLERVLDVFTELLAEKSLAEITMADLAKRSGVAVTSVYARFENKDALAVAAHERLRVEAFAAIDALTEPARWQGAGLDEIAATVVARTVNYRRNNDRLLRALLLVNDREMHERAAAIIRHGSERLAVLLRPRLTWLAAAERDRAVDFAWRAVMAVLQQRLVYGAAEPARYRLAQTELIRRLTHLFTATLRN